MLMDILVDHKIGCCGRSCFSSELILVSRGLRHTSLIGSSAFRVVSLMAERGRKRSWDRVDESASAGDCVACWLLKWPFL